MKKIFSLILVLLLSVVLFSACSNEGNEENKESNAVEENTQVNLETEENNEGEKAEDEEIKEGIFPGNIAYDFTLLDKEGNEISLSSLREKVVFLNFWASWCGPCQAEMPHMQKVYEEYKDKDVVILAVNLTLSERGGIEGVNSFLEENKYTFPVLYDSDEDQSVGEKYRVSSIPTTYIINKEGIIVNRLAGAMNEEMIKEQIELGME
ncbi:TlpA disulfide reductase family protein [Maledivibacter halophilus]|uniref:Peroxiredoxin n=1 Tax=Maledivibacter halophilus TaxID=36842 RepID=A0A1T5M6H2_9FIRM|nr:TlpA disulfide reductase family protein [Maledivibacter halophilus]SKC83723.1 Peroxiredoxin [Maledivibacter halophilus]